ncbi:MAG: molybdate ABC transporter permease subunit [Desulfuromonas sp.]|nr:MAG: molybdate ABC transporter permease subunit [Desulfuromonas sp.]
METLTAAYEKAPRRPGVLRDRLLRFDLLMALLTALFFSLILLVLLSLVGAASWREVIAHVGSSRGFDCILLSLKTSFAVVVLTLLLGFPAAYILALKQFRGKAFLDTLLDLPIIMPPLVTGLCLLLLLNQANPVGRLLQEWGVRLLFTPGGIILAQFFVAAPFFIKTVRESIAAIPSNLLAASATLNASDFYTFRRVVLPLCRKGACAGMAMTWARALGEFGATAMVAGSIPGRTETMTIAIYMEAMSGGLGNSISTALVLVLFSFTLLFVLKLQAGRQYEY